MLRAERFNSIREIGVEKWNSIVTSADVFHSYQFTELVEESKVENAGFCYMVIYDDNEIVCTAAFSNFDISLDIFITGSAFVQKLKRMFPNIFKIRILVCGLPASFGQSNLKLVRKDLASEVCKMISDEMKTLARQKRISLMAIKELSADEKDVFSHFSTCGFFLANSIPYMVLDVRWDNFENYLLSLRHSYRRKIKKTLKKIGMTEPVIIPAAEYDKNSNSGIALVLSEADANFSDEFYSKYLSVMERTPTKLETLNNEFFKKLFSQTKSYHTLDLVANGTVVSSAILIFAGEELVFMLVGRSDEKDDHDSYFNLVYGIIQVAIQKKIKKIKMGQTAYWVKQCVGATAHPEFIYFGSRKKVGHAILKSMRNLIFPETVLPKVNVFN